MYTYSRATVYHIHVLQLLEPIQRREYDRILDMHHRRTPTHRMDPVTARLPPALVPQRPRLEALAAFKARLPHAAIRGLRLHGGGGHVVLREHAHDEGIALVHLRKREGRRQIYVESNRDRDRERTMERTHGYNVVTGRLNLY